MASMKTLDQIEPRIVIPGGAAFVISQPGSYVLGGDITVTTGNAITIQSPNVTLDLGGYVLSSTASTPNGNGVALNGGGNIHVTIFNGHIRGTTGYNGTFSGGGFTSGINYQNLPLAIQVRNVSVSGVSNTGINLGTDPSTSVIGCTVRIAGTFGIRAGVVADSSATIAGVTGISAKTVSNSVGTLGTGVTSIISTQPTADTRTPISSAPFTISQGGSYVLTGNLTVATGNAITVAADSVSLDLNGFTISSTASPANGFAINIDGGRTNIAIANGQIRSGATYTTGSFTDGPGFSSGVDYSGSRPNNCRVTHLTVSGVAGYGIDLGSGQNSTVIGCAVNVVGTIGIRSGAVADSSATVCGSTSINALTVSNCVGSLAAGGTGISVTGSTLDSLATTLGATQIAVDSVRTNGNATYSAVGGVQSTATATQTAVGGVQSTASATQTAVGNVQTTANSILAASETRTPISSLPFTISTSGSYYFTRNLHFTFPNGNAITISANDVTLDLCGFTLSSIAAVTGNAIEIDSSSTRGIIVKNGSITGNTSVSISGTAPNETWNSNPAGFRFGIFDNTLGCSSYQDLSIRGCRRDGLSAVNGKGTIVDRVSTYENGENGIFCPHSSISSCTATTNGGAGFNAGDSSITNSTASFNGASGFFVHSGPITNSSANYNSGDGISADYGSIINCATRENGGSDIRCHYGVVAFCRKMSWNVFSSALTGNSL